jgi:hypothetical protein
VVAPHTTFYRPQPLPENLRAGHTLTEDDMLQLHIRTQGRDGLLEMYQKLLIEKEKRLSNFISVHQEGASDLHTLMGSRSWRLLVALHRLKYRLLHLR